MKQVLLAGVFAFAAGPVWAADRDVKAAAADEADAQALETGHKDEEAEQPLEDRDTIVVTGTRSILPATALPLTVDVLGGEEFDEQVAVSGSVIALTSS